MLVREGVITPSSMWSGRFYPTTGRSFSYPIMDVEQAIQFGLKYLLKL